MRGWRRTPTASSSTVSAPPPISISGACPTGSARAPRGRRRAARSEPTEQPMNERDYHDHHYEADAARIQGSELFRRVHQRGARQFLHATGAGRAHRVLSLGCGDGSIERHLAPHVAELVGPRPVAGRHRAGAGTGGSGRSAQRHLRSVGSGRAARELRPLRLRCRVRRASSPGRRADRPIRCAPLARCCAPGARSTPAIPAAGAWCGTSPGWSAAPTIAITARTSGSSIPLVARRARRGGRVFAGRRSPTRTIFLGHSRGWRPGHHARLRRDSRRWTT